jgi:hypothetical protein
VAEEYIWRKTDSSTELFHCPDHQDFSLYYARIYTINEGYDYSETNNLILNLKMSVDSSSNRLSYKKEAIGRFAREVSIFLERIKVPITLVPMPPSKTASHPLYDDRIVQVALQVAEAVEMVRWSPILYRTRDVESHHMSSSARDTEKIYRDLPLNEPFASSFLEDTPLVLIDDVLTSGAHFTAAKRRLEARFSNTRVGGIFWAKAQAAKDFD